MYVVDVDNFWIRNISLASGIIGTLAGYGTAGDFDAVGTNAMFYYPYSCALAGTGTIILADYQYNKVKSIVVSTQVVTTLGTVPNVFSVWVNNNNTIYAGSNNAIYRRSLSGSGSFTLLAGAEGVPGSVDGFGLDARFYGLYGLTGDTNGYVYIADSFVNKIRQLNPTNLAVITVVGSGVSSSSGDGGEATSATINGPWGVAMDTTGSSLYIGEVLGSRIR